MLSLGIFPIVCEIFFVSIHPSEHIFCVFMSQSISSGTFFLIQICNAPIPIEALMVCILLLEFSTFFFEIGSTHDKNFLDETSVPTRVVHDRYFILVHKLQYIFFPFISVFFHDAVKAHQFHKPITIFPRFSFYQGNDFISLVQNSLLKCFKVSY